MNRNFLYALIAVFIVAAGVAAFSLGRLLRARAGSSQITQTLGPAAEGVSGTRLSSPTDLSQVSLTDAEGQTVRMGDFEKTTLVFFGFTNCPDVCPLTLSRLARLYENSSETDSVNVVMITVDPDDTPEVTHAYASGFHPDFVGLSGSNNQLAEAIKAFYIGARELPDGLYSHPDAVIVLDAEGRMRYVYSGASVGALEQDLPKLLDEFSG